MEKSASNIDESFLFLKWLFFSWTLFSLDEERFYRQLLKHSDFLRKFDKNVENKKYMKKELIKGKLLLKKSLST